MKFEKGQKIIVNYHDEQVLAAFSQYSRREGFAFVYFIGANTTGAQVSVDAIRPATTADLRKVAHVAADQGNYKLAATLWEQAIEVYPEHHPESRLAAADLAMMRKFAKRCRQQAGG